MKAPKVQNAVRRFDRATLRSVFNQVDWHPSGRVTDVIGNSVIAHLPGARIGNVVTVSTHGDDAGVAAEVIGFRDETKAVLMPYATVAGIAPGCAVRPARLFDRVPVGDFLLGRVIDPMFRGLDGPLEIPDHTVSACLDREAPNPLTRARIERILPLGIRAIDTLLTMGEGQRIGIMAGSGVGKSVLMGMMARSSNADINVIGLIGERGREVREFLERDLGAEGLKRSVVVVTTSDQSPLMRIRAAHAVTAVAEAFAETGKRVLLIMDSLTRVAMAQREIGLARGEPPTTKGYPPSIFSLLPRLLERCGPQPRGSITGVYTVLVDGDDFNDPIPDAARSILDGHINLSRNLANRGHYPAVDVTTSISRVMHDIVDREHWQAAQTIRMLMGVYQENSDYVQIGAYQAGTNPTLDAAISLMPTIETFLRQGINDQAPMEESLKRLANLFKGPPQSGAPDVKPARAKDSTHAGQR